MKRSGTWVVVLSALMITGFSGCLVGSKSSSSPADTSSTGSGGSGGVSLTIADLATNPSHAGTSSEGYTSPCTVSTLTTSINSGTTHSYYDILFFDQSGAWSYTRLWYEGTNCYLSAGDANSNGVPDGSSVIQISMGGSASITRNISGSKFEIEMDNTSGSSLTLAYQVIKNWYTGACTNGPSFTYSSDSSETRTMNGIDCTPWGDFPSNASSVDGKIFNVIQKIDDSHFEIGALPTNQMGPGLNEALGYLDTSTTPSVTFTRYTY